MQVTFLKEDRINKKNYVAGDTINLVDSVAKSKIGEGICEETTKPKPKKKEK